VGVLRSTPRHSKVLGVSAATTGHMRKGALPDERRDIEEGRN